MTGGPSPVHSHALHSTLLTEDLHADQALIGDIPSQPADHTEGSLHGALTDDHLP